LVSDNDDNSEDDLPEEAAVARLMAKLSEEVEAMDAALQYRALFDAKRPPVHNSKSEGISLLLFSSQAYTF
jgi:hypothetical protein